MQAKCLNVQGVRALHLRRAAPCCAVLRCRIVGAVLMLAAILSVVLF